MKIMDILAIVACGFGAYFCAETLGCLLCGGKLIKNTPHGKKLGWKRFWRYHTVGITLRAIGIGIIVGLAHYLPRKLESPACGLIFFLIMLALLVACTVWYVRRATRWSEMLWFAGLATAIMLAVQVAVHVMALWWESRTLSWLFFVTPWMLYALLVGFAAVTTAARKYDRTEAGVWGLLAWLLIFATLASLIVIPIKGNQIAGLPATSGAKALAEAPTEVANTTTVGEAIENLTVRKLTVEELEQLTSDKYKNVSEELLTSSLTPHDKRRTSLTGFSDALTYGFETKENSERFWELEVEILRNPVYGVTVANAIRDKKIGDKKIGDFNPWMDEMVSKNAKEGTSTWCEYRGNDGTIYVTTEYRQYAATLCTFLERLLSQGVQTRQTEENWCLNNSSTNNARAGVKASYQYAKEALVLAYVSKAEAGKDSPKGLFVIGFNLHDKRPEFYGDNAPEIVNKPKSSGGSSGGGGNNPSPSPTSSPQSPTSSPENPTVTPTQKPTSAPTQAPTYYKDKSKSDNSGKNDSTGPGEDTNNGVDAQYSTKDKDSNSNHMTATEYEQAIKDLEVINDSQKTGQDDSTPSYHGGGTVDNSGAAANNPSSQGGYEVELPSSGESGKQHWDGAGT